MSKIIKALVALMLCAAFTSSVHAEFRWKNPGADPYAPSREEAMKTRESAFLKLGFPTEVTALLMEATKVPGKKVKLEMGSRLAAMLSKGGAVHKDVVIDWKAPIRGTELVAPAEMWQITHEGKIYTVFLFEVCNNWSSVIASAPTASALPPVAVATAGCVKIHFTTKPGDTVVKFPVIGPDGPDISKDSCTGIKRAGDSTFGPWRNEFCSAEAPILCDFSQHERIIGQKVRLMGSYRIEAHGEHVLRLPALIAAKKSGYVTALILVRQVSRHPKYPAEKPGSTQAFAAALVYGEQRQEWIDDNSDAIGVRWFDYTRGTVKVWYDRGEVPKDAAQLYWPWKEWRGP